MADLSDAVRGVANLLNGAFYPEGRPLAVPNGNGQIVAATLSQVGCQAWISRGWPLPAAVDLAVVKSKGVWISVFPQVNLTQVTSAVLRRWEDLPMPDPTVTLTVDDNAGTVTIEGADSVDLPQMLTLLVGASAYAVPIAATDTPATLAAALAAAVAPDYPSAAALGGVFTIDEGGALIARVSRKGTMLGETERERQSIMITVWAPDDDTRYRAAKLARETLAAAPRLPLADGSAGNLYYRQTNDSDNFEKVGIYRRDIHYWLEFSTFIRVDGYEVTAPAVVTTPG